MLHGVVSLLRIPGLSCSKVFYYCTNIIVQTFIFFFWQVRGHKAKVRCGGQKYQSFYGSHYLLLSTSITYNLVRFFCSHFVPSSTMFCPQHSQGKGAKGAMLSHQNSLIRSQHQAFQLERSLALMKFNLYLQIVKT